MKDRRREFLLEALERALERSSQERAEKHVTEALPLPVTAQERPPDPGMLTWLQQRIEAAEAERREIREQHTAELARVHAQLQQVHDQLAEALVEAQQLRHLLTGQQRLQLSREGVVRDADIQDLVLEVEPEPRSYSAWLRATRKAEF